MTWKSTITKYEFILAVFSFILLFVSLYQLEIVYIAISENWSVFCFPFFVYCTNNYALVRDVWYSLIILAFFILLYAIWRWE